MDVDDAGCGLGIKGRSGGFFLGIRMLKALVRFVCPILVSTGFSKDFECIHRIVAVFRIRGVWSHYVLMFRLSDGSEKRMVLKIFSKGVFECAAMNLIINDFDRLFWLW